MGRAIFDEDPFLNGHALFVGELQQCLCDPACDVGERQTLDFSIGHAETAGQDGKQFDGGLGRFLYKAQEIGPTDHVRSSVS